MTGPRRAKRYDHPLRCLLACLLGIGLMGGVGVQVSATVPQAIDSQNEEAESPNAQIADIQPETSSPSIETESPLAELDFSNPRLVLDWIQNRLNAGEGVLPFPAANRLVNWVIETAPALRQQLARDLYFGTGQLAFGVVDDERVLELFIRARQLAEGLPLIGDIQLWIGDVHAVTGAYEQALNAYLLGLDVAGVRPETEAELLLSLGDVSRRLNETDRALDYFDQAWAIAEAESLEDVLVQIELFRAVVYRQLDQNEQALGVYQEGLEQALTMDDPVLVAMFYNNMGNVLRDMGDYPEALSYFDQALEISESQGVDYGVGINHVNQAVVYYLQEDFERSLGKYEQAKAILNAMDRPAEQRSVYEGLAYVYQALGQYEAAFDALMRFNELNNQIFNTEIQIAAEEIQTRYETLLKDSELALQASELERQQQRIYQALLVIIALVVIIGGLMAFVRYRNRAFRALYLRNKELMLATARARQARQLNRERGLTVSEADAALADEPPGEDLQSDALSRDPHSGESGSVDKLSSEDRLRALYERLMPMFDDEKLYTKADLSIEELASRLNSNRTYVSQAISLVTGMSFRRFVNFHRVNEARRLMHDQSRSWSVQDLAEEVGFRSISSLYRAFDQHVGMSPARYLEVRKTDRTDSAA